MNTIDINLSLSSPLYVAFPDNKDDRNICRTTKKPIVDNGRTVQTPYFPANGLRGGLRRKAAARVMEQLCKDGPRVPSHLYLGLTCGASSGSPDQTALSVEEILRARRNAYMGIFGGGARLLQSAYRVSDINPVLDLTVRTGAVPASCQDRVVARTKDDQVSYLSPWEVTGGILNLIRVDDVYRVMREDEIQRFMQSPVESVAAHQQAVGVNKNERKDGGASKEDVANMMAFETVAAGTPMHFRISLAPDVSEAQMGLMLYAVSDLIRENSLGGLSRIDLGRFKVDTMKIALAESLGGDVIDVSGCGEGQDFHLPASGPIARLLKAADEGVAALTMEEMQGYFTDFSADAKKEKKAKKAA